MCEGPAFCWSSARVQANRWAFVTAPWAPLPDQPAAAPSAHRTLDRHGRSPQQGFRHFGFKRSAGVKETSGGWRPRGSAGLARGTSDYRPVWGRKSSVRLREEVGGAAGGGEMFGVPIRARKAGEEGGVTVDGGTGQTSSAPASRALHLSIGPACPTGRSSSRWDGERLPSSGPRPPPGLSGTSPVVELLRRLP